MSDQILPLGEHNIAIEGANWATARLGEINYGKSGTLGKITNQGKKIIVEEETVGQQYKFEFDDYVETPRGVVIRVL